MAIFFRISVMKIKLLQKKLLSCTTLMQSLNINFFYRTIDSYEDGEKLKRFKYSYWHYIINGIFF